MDSTPTPGMWDANTQAQPGGESPRRVVVKLATPFALERRGYPNREAIVGWDSARTSAYLAAVRREIEANADQFDDCTVAAVRLGGGIATNAPADELLHTVRTLRECLHVEDGAPVSAHASVNNVSGASMPLFRRAGVTRLDLEMLALDRADFVRLNHADAYPNLPYVVDSFLHAYANKSLGYVLAYGFAPANAMSFRRSVVEVTRSPASHLILARWRGAERSDVPCASEEEAAAQLACAREVLSAAGMREYAPLRFARPDDEDPFWALQHSATGDARGCEVLGFGLGAQTRFGGVVSTNTADWDTYLRFSDDFTKITTDVRPA